MVLQSTADSKNVLHKNIYEVAPSQRSKFITLGIFYFYSNQKQYCSNSNFKCKTYCNLSQKIIVDWKLNLNHFRAKHALQNLQTPCNRTEMKLTFQSQLTHKARFNFVMPSWSNSQRPKILVNTKMIQQHPQHLSFTFQYFRKNRNYF